jgi:hypothetical protein
VRVEAAPGDASVGARPTAPAGVASGGRAGACEVLLLVRLPTALDGCSAGGVSAAGAGVVGAGLDAVEAVVGAAGGGVGEGVADGALTAGATLAAGGVPAVVFELFSAARVRASTECFSVVTSSLARDAASLAALLLTTLGAAGGVLTSCFAGAAPLGSAPDGA